MLNRRESITRFQERISVPQTALPYWIETFRVLRLEITQGYAGPASKRECGAPDCGVVTIRLSLFRNTESYYDKTWTSRTLTRTSDKSQIVEPKSVKIRDPPITPTE